MKSFPVSVWTAFWRGCVRIGFCLLFFTANAITAIGQDPVAQFVMPSTGCLGQSIYVKNNSTSASRYEWDLCQGDLALSPTGSLAGVFSGSVTPTGTDIVFDGTNWYAFVTSRDNSSIMRASLGPSAASFGSVVNLGNISNVMSLPTDIKIVSDNGNWYGFVFNEGTNLICRLDFGAALTNVPTATVIFNPGSPNSNQGLDVISDGVQWYVAYTFNSKVGVLRLSTISAVPAPGDQLLTGDLSGAPKLGDIKVLSQQGSFYAYTCSWSSPKLYKLSFGTNLFSTPTETDLSASLPTTPVLYYYGIDGAYDAGNFYLMFATLQGPLVSVNLGADLTQSPSGSQVLGDLGVFSNTVKDRLIKYQSSWYNFGVNYTSGKLYRASFPTPVCQANPGFLTGQSPVLDFSSAGVKYVSLRSFNGGAFDEDDQAIAIAALNAPDIAFSSQNICVNNNINFTSSNSSGNISSYSWGFGDAGSASLTNPSHIYTSTGNYTVDLTVTASNGCQNQTQNPLIIFNRPSASFALPTSSPTCSNQTYTFTNTSTYDNGSNPTWRWRINGIATSASQDLLNSFPAAGVAQVQLTDSIPGCSSQSIQNFTIQQPGPLIDFTLSGNCLGQTSQFTNTTIGSVTSFSWDFGDGNSSLLTNPSNPYAAIGSYGVKLQSTSSNGCQNSASKIVTIYSTPQPDFSLDLPPFSCSGTPSQFNDLTPNPTDSNLSSWAWSFGDAGNGSSSQRNPLYTYSLAGPYTVGMTVTSNFGCSATLQKSIAITQSPTASFANTAACVNQGTQFTDTSAGSIKSRLWKIGNSSYTFNNPIHVFSTPANYTVQLTVTDNNGCIAQTTQSVSVPGAQSPDFSAQSTCATKPAIFQDITPAGIDPLISYSWDFAGQGSGAGTPVQFTFPATGNFSVKMDAHAQSGCVYSVTKTIVIVSPPKAGFTTSTDAGAAPLNVQFNNTSVNATGYLWHFRDQGNSTSTVMSPSFTFADLGDYVVDLDATSAQGCVDIFSKIIRAVLPRVDAGLTDLQFIRDPSSGQLQALFILSNLGNLPLSNPTIVVEISGNATLRENLNLVVLPGQTASQVLNYSFLPAGLRYVCLRVETSQDANPWNDKECVSLDHETIVFSPYPNPVNGELHFDWIASGDEPAQITIFNATGAKAFDRQLESSQTGLNQIRIDVSNLGPGVYLALFTYPGVKKSFRFIVN